MLRHIVLLTFKPEASSDQRAAWQEAVTAMCRDSDQVQSFNLGSNVGSGPNHFDVALVADFEDYASFKTYVASPSHAAYVRDHASQVVDRIAAIQHEF